MPRPHPLAPVLTTLLLTTLFPVAAGAQPPQAAHVHGIAQLQVALLDEALEIELTTPAFNLLGFEHAPHNAAERKAADAVLALLNDPDTLFRLPAAAGCTALQRQIDASVLHSADRDDHHRHDHDHPHDDRHQHAHDGGQRHADISASYSFRCSTPQALQQIDVELFTRFPHLQRIDAQWLSERDQQARTLRTDDTRIPLQ